MGRPDATVVQLCSVGFSSAVSGTGRISGWFAGAGRDSGAAAGVGVKLRKLRWG